jgi:hypothetical protein
MTTYRICIAVLAGGVLLAADFWKAKKPAEWTAKEAQKLVESSPWTREVTPSFDMGAMGGRSGRPSGMGGGMGGPGGGMGGPGGGMGMPNVRVTFETALPIGEAKLRLETPDPYRKLREEYVVISISGMPGRRDREGGPSERDLQQRLLSMTTLKAKDKTYQPAQARVESTSNGPVMLFAFPRKELDLTPEDKQVEFKTAMGPLEVKTKFNLKEMIFDGKLAL